MGRYFEREGGEEGWTGGSIEAILNFANLLHFLTGEFSFEIFRKRGIICYDEYLLPTIRILLSLLLASLGFHSMRNFGERTMYI